MYSSEQAKSIDGDKPHNIFFYGEKGLTGEGPWKTKKKTKNMKIKTLQIIFCNEAGGTEASSSLALA